MKANHNKSACEAISRISCSLQHKDTKNESKSQLKFQRQEADASCSLQHKDTKNESKSQLLISVYTATICCSLQHKDTKNESKSQLRTNHN